MTAEKTPTGRPLQPGELSFEVALMCSCGCGFVFKSNQHAFIEGQSVERTIHHIASKVYLVVDRMDRHLDETKGPE
jgi:hypothetical protein